MFTGIVQGMAEVVALEKKQGLHRLAIRLPDGLNQRVTLGASIALNGVCMTVSQFADGIVEFDAMAETLTLTSLGDLTVGDKVNVERSAKQGDEIGGHLVSGHVDGIASVVTIDTTENNQRVAYELPETAMPYLFKKGFISFDGCSLTIADIDKSQRLIWVSYIPETLRVTVHGVRQVGDRVNFEIDRQTQAIVDTVKQLLQENPELLRADS